MKIIVTGGCGFVGSTLCLFLKKNLPNSTILSIDNLSKIYSKFNHNILKKNKIRNEVVNLGKFNCFSNIKFKSDFIIDCSAEPSVEASKKNISKVISSNFLSTHNILEKTKIDNSKLIFISSSRAYPIKNSYLKFEKYKKQNKHLPYSEKEDFSGQKTIYGFTKYSSEKLIEEYNYSCNLKYIINRCALISGPGQFGRVEQGLVSLWLWRHMNKLSLEYFGYNGKGEQVRDVLFIDDLCNLILKQIKSFHVFQNNAFCIGGGLKNSTNLKNLTKICEEITNNRVKISGNMNTSIYDIPYYVTSLKKIKKFTKWEPKISLYDGLESTYNWMKKNQNKIRKFF